MNAVIPLQILLMLWLAFIQPACAMSRSKADLQQERQTLAAEKSHRLAVTVMLRVPGGGNLGSGVVIGETDTGYWVATNRHVVQDRSNLCVVGADRSAVGAVVIPPGMNQRKSGLDLAFLWLPRGSFAPRVVATRAEVFPAASDLPVVVSTGYPIEIKISSDGPPYREQEGLLLPLVDRPLEGGYDMTYSIPIGKSMSGGGVFLGSRLIGINGVHADPLWPSTWRRADGALVDPILDRKLALVSMGISLGIIDGQLRSSSGPTDAQIRSLDGLDCVRRVPEKTERLSIS
jgi:hypothetical protein